MQPTLLTTAPLPTCTHSSNAASTKASEGPGLKNQSLCQATVPPLTLSLIYTRTGSGASFPQAKK